MAPAARPARLRRTDARPLQPAVPCRGLVRLLAMAWDNMGRHGRQRDLPCFTRRFSGLPPILCVVSADSAARRREAAVLTKYSRFVRSATREINGHAARRDGSAGLCASARSGRERPMRQTACKPGSVRPCGRDGHSSATRLAARLVRPTRAAGRECPCVTCPGFPGPAAGRPYSVLLPVGFALPLPLPGARCALAAPFHPCPRGILPGAGGIISVALSLGSPPPAVGRHRIPVEPGLSSDACASAAVRPSGDCRDARARAVGQARVQAWHRSGPSQALPPRSDTR